ncbi:MAG TPA: hypothetical protein DCS93_32045 [Microscillaceae bacterium]|nr:hypothetical protein [Microscillaceae bacterium]
MVSLNGRRRRTIRITGHNTGPDNALTPRMRWALEEAVREYNALNLDLRFLLDFANANLRNQDIVFVRDNSVSVAVAGPPANGNPASLVRLNGNDLSNMSRARVKTVMMHELGHTIGFRHTDWFDKSISCGGPRNVEQPGAIHIPGTSRNTAANIDRNSIMLSCSTAEDFSRQDIVALRFLY